MKKVILFLALIVSPIFLSSVLINSSSFASIPTKQIIPFGGDFQLTDQNNQAFNLKQLRGKVVMMFFGYTSCPEVCPTELSKMVSTLKSLGADADKVQALFVSVDPERDSVTTINRYLKGFRSNLIGLTGSKAEIDQVTQQYKVTYKAMKMMGKDYHVQHSANIFVINDDGKLDTIVPYGMPYEHVTKVVKSLLDER